MAAAVRTNPRKIASQQRSRRTVDALLEATARILIREGFDKASTNRVAEVAGVSIGSLYQYFPSKEALVAALIDRHNRRVMQAVQGELAEALDLSIEEAVRKLVSVAVRAHRIDPKLHRVLAEQIPRVGKLENVETFNRQYYVLFENYLGSHRDEIRAMDLGVAAFVCVTSIEALTHMAVVHRKIISEEAMEALVEEATRLVVGYLRENCGRGNLESKAGYLASTSSIGLAALGVGASGGATGAHADGGSVERLGKFRAG